MNIKNQGFTIVELLIVIVVISILATITVVAYNGIQDRAKNAQLLSSFDTAEKALRLYEAEKGETPATISSQPNSVDLPDGINIVCIGKPSDYPATDFFGAGECLKELGGGQSTVTATSSADLNNRLSEYASNISVNSGANTIVNNDGGYTYGSRGIMYISSGYNAELMYYQEGDAQCGRGYKNFQPPEDEFNDIMPKGYTMCGIGIGEAYR